MRIDWPALILALTPKHGDAKRTAREMDRAGLTIQTRAIYRWRRGISVPSADFAVWLVEKAHRIGVDIPKKK